MRPTTAIRMVQQSRALDEASEALAWQLALDGRYMMAQCVALLRMTSPPVAAAGLAVLYDIAAHNGMVPRSDRADHEDEELPF